MTATATTTTTTTTTPQLPGASLDMAKMPGHWLLARMGKRVLRPGGVEMTQAMLDALEIGREDVVVEMAPGLGMTAQMALAKEPAGYIGIERDEAAAAIVRAKLSGPVSRCVTGTAAHTGLDDASASVVVGEAMLTMQTATQKRAIVREAFRALKPGGRYGIHELALGPEEPGPGVEAAVERDLSAAIRVGARPLTLSEWRTLLEAEGFEVLSHTTSPMHLLEPKRVLQDEGLRGVLKIAFNVLRSPAARRRIVGMRAAFRRHQDVLCAISLVAQKPRSGGES